MTQQQQEQVSALQDGELGPSAAARLYECADRDPQIRALWERYHLIGSALRGEPIVPEYRHIADAVRESLVAEPAILAPTRRRSAARPGFAPFAGAALAAGAAFLAVFAVPGLFQGQDAENAQARTATPLAINGPASGAETGRWQTDRPDLANKLGLFLVNHQEMAPATGMKGMLPYATLVGYDIGR
jgi:sigma-E factor negative regulatory protein RseA